jgi:short-subunit dehydrogenase
VKDLKNKLVLLTGASSGLGPYIARRLDSEGCRFILSARRPEELDRVAAELREARVIPADLSQRGEAERLAQAAGPVDILVANAGVPASGRLTDFEIDQLDRALDVNLRAPMVLARLLLPGMLERKDGHLVLMASLAGKVPAPKSSVYNATKFALRGFGHALAAELRRTGVGVSVVSPTFVDEAGMFAESGARVPVRLVKPGQVADAVVRGILRRKVEIVVAPFEQRLFGRMVGAMPELIQAAGGAGALPDEAVNSQERKR